MPNDLGVHVGYLVDMYLIEGPTVGSLMMAKLVAILIFKSISLEVDKDALKPTN